MPSSQPILIQKFTGFTLTCSSATRALSSTDLDCVALLICPTNHHHHLPQLGQCCTLIYTTHTYALHLNIQIHKNHSHIHAGIYQKKLQLHCPAICDADLNFESFHNVQINPSRWLWCMYCIHLLWKYIHVRATADMWTNSTYDSCSEIITLNNIRLCLMHTISLIKLLCV